MSMMPIAPPPDLVDSPSLSVDRHFDLHWHSSTLLIVRGLALDGGGINKLTFHNHLILLVGAKLDL
jgi:hypothetical protein